MGEHEIDRPDQIAEPSASRDTWHIPSQSMMGCATTLVGQARDPAVSLNAAPAHWLPLRDDMKRTSSMVALAFMSFVPLCMTFACGPAETSQSGATSNSDDPPSPEETSTCEPRQAGISADFELTVEDWPDDADDSFDVIIAAPCQVEAASSTARHLACTDEDGAVHPITLTILNSHILGAVPESGPVFLQAAHESDYAPSFDYYWFEVRAGSDVTGALLAGGVQAPYPRPSGPSEHLPAEPYFAPIGMAISAEEGCPQIQDECVVFQRARISLWIDDVPAGSILDGHEEDIGAGVGYRVVVGASEEHHSTGTPECTGDDPNYRDDLRILIGANAPEGAIGTSQAAD
ncbi:hypothetical protein WMF30_32970 [Sorangium sp. So ce134]